MKIIAFYSSFTIFFICSCSESEIHGSYSISRTELRTSIHREGWADTVKINHFEYDDLFQILCTSNYIFVADGWNYLYKINVKNGRVEKKIEAGGQKKYNGNVNGLAVSNSYLLHYTGNGAVLFDHDLQEVKRITPLIYEYVSKLYGCPSDHSFTISEAKILNEKILIRFSYCNNTVENLIIDI